MAPELLVSLAFFLFVVLACLSVILRPHGFPRTSDFVPHLPIPQTICGLVHPGTAQLWISVTYDLVSLLEVLSTIATLLGKCVSFPRSKVC